MILVPAAIKVLCLLGAAEMGVRFVSLPLLARRFGLSVGDIELSRCSSAYPKLSRRELRNLRILARLAPHWPFCKGPCLRHALVAGRLLRRHGPVLRIGASLDGGDVLGHAWVEVGTLTIGETGDFPALRASPAPPSPAAP
jgi:hypothetical protein